MDDVNKVSEDLVDTLRGIRRLVEELEESSRRKEAMVKSGDVDGLRELLGHEEDTVSILAESESKRQALADAMASAVGVSGGGRRLGDLLEADLPPASREKLTRAGEELGQELQRLSRQNERLRGLLQFKIDYTDFMMNLLLVPKKNLFSYNVWGNKEDGAGGLNLLDYRA